MLFKKVISFVVLVVFMLSVATSVSAASTAPSWKEGQIGPAIPSKIVRPDLNISISHEEVLLAGLDNRFRVSTRSNVAVRIEISASFHTIVDGKNMVYPLQLGGVGSAQKLDNYIWTENSFKATINIPKGAYYFDQWIELPDIDGEGQVIFKYKVIGPPVKAEFGKG